MKLRRLNLDTSWEIIWEEFNIVIDPWLVGSEVDYFKWFNEQWHTREPIHPDEIEKPDLILVSQSYSDHCHEETLKRFPKDIPIAASPRAYKRLKKSFAKERLIELPILSKRGFWQWNGFQIASIDPGKYFDPIYYAHVIVREGKGVFYSSHGFEFSDLQKTVLKNIDFDVLLTSFSEIKIPSILGGKVNPGLENVTYLIEKLHPQFVLNTHDEEKEHKGVVMKLAKTKYPDYSSLNFRNTTFINQMNYESMELTSTVSKVD